MKSGSIVCSTHATGHAAWDPHRSGRLQGFLASEDTVCIWRVPRSRGTVCPQGPTVQLCLGPYCVRRGSAFSCERGTPVSCRKASLAVLDLLRSSLQTPVLILESISLDRGPWCAKAADRFSDRAEVVRNEPEKNVLNLQLPERSGGDASPSLHMYVEPWSEFPIVPSYRVPSLITTPPPYDPTVALCLGTYGDPKGEGFSCERNTPILTTHKKWTPPRDTQPCSDRHVALSQLIQAGVHRS